jgi:uncharacterized protein (TIGR04255 family)
MPLNVPAAGPAHFAKNFIRLAVCELRFPTLFELEADRPPLGFSKSIRKDYPSHELLKNVNLSPGGVAHATAHAFRSRKGRWRVTLRASALSLETSNYDAFSEFADRLRFVVEAAEQTIDSDFFTRVGLRYINALPLNVAEIGELLNQALVAPLADGTFGDVAEHWQRVRGTTAIGGYTFQHGVALEPQAGSREYVLDFDFYREDVSLKDTVEVVGQLHRMEFAMFDWALGPKAKEFLGPSTLEQGA